MAAEPVATLTAPVAGSPEVTVSVIMIFRNAQAFIAEAIESVLAQTLKSWELLLVDDGSTDGSSEIAANYARCDPARIRLLAHPGRENRGMSASRNLGLHAASGRYVAFLDADDVYLPLRLQRHVEILDRQPGVDMVQSELVHWYSWETRAVRKDDDYVRPFVRPDDHLLTPPDGLLLAIAVPLYSAGICNITVRRNVLLELGGSDARFPAEFEDQVVLAKIYLHKTTYVLRAHLAKYRRHAGSWTRRAKEQGAARGIQDSPRRLFRAWLVEYVAGSGVRDPVLEELLIPLRAEAVSMEGGTMGAGSARLAAGLRRTALRWMPPGALRPLLRWNRRREFRNARAQYTALCRRLKAAGRADPSGFVGHAVRPEASGPPTVSVIMIFRDAARFMEEAIQSVLAQTWADWELLLVDDGSTDQGTAIAQRYASANPDRIRCLEHPGHLHRGTGPTRNLGLAMARGRYATFIDADDVYLPDRLERHVAVFRAHPRAQLVISGELYWHEWDRESGRMDQFVVTTAPYDTLVEPPVLLRTALSKRGAAMPTPNSITFDRQLALDLGAIPTRFTSQYEDQALIAKLMLAAAAVVLDAPLVKYRQHPESLTHRLQCSGEYRPGRPHEALFDYLEWLRGYVAENAPQYSDLEQTLYRRLWPTRHPAWSGVYETARSVYRSLRGGERH